MHNIAANRAFVTFGCDFSVKIPSWKPSNATRHALKAPTLVKQLGVSLLQQQWNRDVANAT